MGTSLTPAFWRLSAVLLAASVVITFVVSTVLDALVVRARRRRAQGRSPMTRTTETPRRPDKTAVPH
ncbi:hypothetical protein Sipo8835_18415 [Streptomyces ipomoeae]|uniref:Uncharacterized protein n=2 Tax=Streptomyces ipomoeae TaxID=103232 RepID=L1KHW4_9ACTN|nr:hypothetical protein STRIP9103_09271 [Streptomyces ipomoeae 91-03]TQE33309.1 hypothetical protein Sipo8835_18415 [Streptomyces ipomoeae]TQE39563.1 hypothetical protein Sipo7851_03465 [Streptomyces ipomoeae]